MPPPPLPPRPSIEPMKPALQSKPTTAISSMNIQTLSFPDGTRGTFTSGEDTTAAPEPVIIPGDLASTRGTSAVANDLDEGLSVMSFVPTVRPPGDLESLMVGDNSNRTAAWHSLRSQAPTVPPFEKMRTKEGSLLTDFPKEFDDIPDESEKDWHDWDRLEVWKSKLKHYMILSSAGKPIYSRHGDLALINSYMGVVQTIISFYEGAKNPLLGFTAGTTRFVIATEGPLYLIAISKLGESDSQLRAQLDALYMQILSTLTLPTLTHIFANRPSSDLRKPLEGTESLLSSLADSFTKGSPSALLGALECLKIRKSHRHSINNAFLKTRADKLLYGLIVAGGKLVSVIRPRRHSLHPSDLQLIFNMLFESGGIKATGGENWIPICLPAFNNRGYLYMYVSFLDSHSESPSTSPKDKSSSHDDDTAVILISPDKESFFALQKMKDDVVVELKNKGSLDIIRTATTQGRPKVDDVAPGLQTSHFLFKSKANVQFCMSSLEPLFSDLVSHRRLMSLYHSLHATVHARHSHLKILHCVGDDATSLAWITPIFEFYCVAGPNTSRQVMTQGANEIIQWAKREEERLFIIGGGVF
ncbi:trafficking protein Mon1-domain-containing protein [Pseudomassariella vexata]|uniref:Vacuolar fusion protein MON1 n=1 Tax=Pseudomassariella vexata TaxID=1141098 RepID=A0A1Y2E376_9PEZI|nr:trafficking protein Mon1-domain-containing protein [Pseudomassariella vexata]ORY65959.1 trafficking protein Mon1-domain-containing protein [Pseudomassariella vexata]